MPFFRYPKIFWDDKEIRNASPSELKRLIDRLRSSPVSSDRLRFKAFVRRMIERGSAGDALLFLTPDEIREFLEQESVYCMDERMESLWKKISGLPESFQLKRARAGKPRSSGLS
jgi:hypothetical protein